MDSPRDETADQPATGSPGMVRPAAFAEIPHDLYCQQCGYNLRGLTSDRCPECGRSLEAVRSAISQIPWVYRKDLGLFRAYWRTVWMATFRQKRLCDEMARPVSYPDSQSFRWVTVLHAYVPVLAVTVASYVLASWRPVDGEFWDVGFQAVWPVAVLHICLLLFLAAATGVPSYFFHPRDVPVTLQNRAIALSYYAGGPLAITGLPILAGSFSYALGLDNDLGMGLAIFTAVFPCAQLAAWFLDLTHLTRRVLPQ
jgi:hypothetical protein